MSLTDNVITALAIMTPIVLVIAAFTDRAMRESNKSKSFVNRKLKYTALELICYGLYLLVWASMGFLLVYKACSDDNWFFTIITMIFGFLLSVNFFLLLNHVFYEVLQKVTLNYQTGELSARRFGRVTMIQLADLCTMQIKVVPLWHTSYGGRDFKFFGARFSKTVIQNGSTCIQLSGLRRKHFDFSDYISRKNVLVIKRQIIFIV